MSFNIAIDGPAGAGKSTIAKRFAKNIGFIYVDTGAMYRAMGLYFLEHGIPPEDESKINEACGAINITIEYENEIQRVLLNGENVNDRIRTEEVGNVTSVTSVYPKVRDHLTELQRNLAAASQVIMDGRDIGTCVLPNAQLKIYLTASADTRAARRMEQLTEKGIFSDIEQIKKDIKARDERDMTREIAPLKQAEDAVYVDTSHMDIEEILEYLNQLYEDRKK